MLGMTADPAAGGYWLVASDGGVFSLNARSTARAEIARADVGTAPGSGLAILLGEAANREFG